MTQGQGPAAAPLVSVVIPTRSRPRALVRAIRSVLQQSMTELEVVVVLDGPDEETRRAAAGLGDVRVRVITLEQSGGGSAARNAGVRAARGNWIAFLDDDDEFLPRKLELQLAAASRQAGEDFLVVCRARVVSPRRSVVWPRRFPAPGERLCRYLFCRRRLRQGDAFLQTSTCLLARALALRVPFREGLARHQDWDWLLRLESLPGFRIVPVEEPLTVYHAGSGPSISRGRGWRVSLAWANEAVKPRCGKTYSFFIATQCVPRLTVGECCRWPVMRTLAGEFCAGRPGAMAALLFTGFWLRGVVRGIRTAAGP